MKQNLSVWILLSILTITSFMFSETSIGRFSTIALMATALAKCCLVGFQFMDLKKAHLVWKTSYIFIFGLFSLVVLAIVFAA